jgi:EAL domain-containing protein (putative c-di-GMP-specific phosphodiesterase class I)
VATAAAADAVAGKAATAMLSIAAAFGVRSIAAGIDTPATRELLAALGCQEGLGDCFGFVAAGAHGSVAKILELQR